MTNISAIPECCRNCNVSMTYLQEFGKTIVFHFQEKQEISADHMLEASEKGENAITNWLQGRHKA